jgi:hypothetical protein
MASKVGGARRGVLPLLALGAAIIGFGKEKPIASL